MTTKSVKAKLKDYKAEVLDVAKARLKEDDSDTFGTALKKELDEWKRRTEDVNNEVAALKKSCADTPDEEKALKLIATWNKYYQQYNETRRKLVKKSEEVGKGGKRGGGGGGGDEDEDAMEERIAVQMQMQDQHFRMDNLNMEAELQAAKKEAIDDILVGVTEVNHQYQLMEGMLNEQAPQLETALANVETAQDNVQVGTKDIQKAGEYQKKSRKKMCCIIGFLLIIVVVFIVVMLLV